MRSTIYKLNDLYRDFFLDHRENVKDHFQWLSRYLVEHKCTFRGEAMPTLLKPNFISHRQRILLKNSVEMMSSALTKFIALYLSDDRVREIMAFSEREEELFSIDPGYSNPLVISRLDAFLQGDSIKFLEFNCDSPAGIAYGDIQESGFREMFRNFPFLDGFTIEYRERQSLLLESLLECYAEFRNVHRQLPEKPVIAIVDWAGVSTYSEFELHAEYFRENGIDSVIASPLDFSIRNGRAFAGEREVHLVYKRVITRELLSRWDEVANFVEAIREGAVCCCNAFRSLIVGNKKVLSVISDPRYSFIFNEAEKRLIKQTVPWTRVLGDFRVTFMGEEVDLTSFIPAHKNQLVLKPSNKYGGKDVYIGQETPQTTWEEVMKAHVPDHSWVVQEYVDIPTGQFPEIGESVEFKTKYVNINPYALHGKYSGTITRISDNQVINVSAGGGLVPTLTVSSAPTQT